MVLISQKCSRVTFKCALVGCALFFCLFAESLIVRSDFGALFLGQIVGVFRDPSVQWIVVMSVVILFSTLILAQLDRPVFSFSNRNVRNMWIMLMVMGATYSYLMHSAVVSRATSALTFVVGATIGQLFSVWRRYDRLASGLTIVVLIVLLAGASLYPTNPVFYFQYHGRLRWLGPWSNPNNFGLLMGIGLVLSIGTLALNAQARKNSKSELERGAARRASILQWCLMICVFSAAVVMARGLLHSYSRGAWVATLAGVAYLFYALASFSVPDFRKWLWKYETWLSLAIASAGVITFFCFRETKWPPARRVFSIANQNDFSWRNRVAAWESALQMVAEKPWFGLGWNQPEPAYVHYYGSQPDESVTIRTNDYFTIGSSLGVPILVCFSAYLLSLLVGKVDVECSGWELVPLRGAVIVLLVGFWFEEGLSQIELAVPFWVLLGLAGAVSEIKRERPE